MTEEDLISIQTLRVDPESGIDLEQLEYNLSLTVTQRLELYFQWLELIEMARDAGRKRNGMDPRATEAAE
jgi:hypothetical protein